MYKVIGGDRLQYGPISADQVRDWIKQGRLNKDSICQPDGTSDWTPLGEMPEFAEALATSAATTPTDGNLLTPGGVGMGGSTWPNAGAGAGQAPTAEQILDRNVQLDVGGCFNRAWAVLMADFWAIIGVNALITVLLVLAAGSVLLSLILAGPLLAGMFHYDLRRVRGTPASMEDAFAGFSGDFLHLFLASIVTHLLIVLGLAFCVIPGIYLFVAWIFAYPLVLELHMEFWPAMELSRRVVSSNFWSMLWLLILAAIINFIGTLACVVGIFFTAPLTLLALAFAYEDLFTSGSNSREAAGSPAAP